MVIFIIGILAGILGGLGLGGGTLLIPMLSLVTEHNHFTLQLYNLLFFFPTSIVSLYFHNKNGFVNKEVAKSIIFIAFVGAFIGSRFALKVDDEVLRKLFGAFVLVIGFHQLYNLKKEKN